MVMTAIHESQDNVLDRFRHMMGTHPDGEIASLAGVQRNTVMAYRRRLGIQAYIGHRFKPTGDELPELMPPQEPVAESVFVAAAASQAVAPAEPVAAPVEPVVQPIAPVAEPAAPTVPGRRVADRGPFQVRRGQGFMLTVSRGDTQTVYVISGQDLAEALKRAIARLDEEGEPYQMVGVRYVADALMR